MQATLTNLNRGGASTSVSNLTRINRIIRIFSNPKEKTVSDIFHIWVWINPTNPTNPQELKA